MGEVYRARDARLSRTVAIKVLLAASVATVIASNVSCRRRAPLLLSPIRTLSRGYEIGCTRPARSTYLVMEYVAGRVADQRISEEARCLVAGARLCRADGRARLPPAHAAGIVHRDIKPDNVIVTPEGQREVLDFGLAKLVQRDLEDPGAETRTRAALLTEPGMVMGTAAYMLPSRPVR